MPGRISRHVAGQAVLLTHVGSNNQEMNFDSDKHFGLVDIANGELEGCTE
jgi:hypothetical protein